MIALTALAMKGDRERCLAVGASDYMNKPFKLIDLARLVERFLKE
jgi:CheY-like chemotaxis protein